MNLKRKEKKSQSRRLGKYLKEQKGRIYIIRRCVMMLLCSRDWYFIYSLRYIVTCTNIYTCTCIYICVWECSEIRVKHVYTRINVCALMRNFVNEKVTCYYNILIVHHLSNIWNMKQRFSYSDSKCA